MGISIEEYKKLVICDGKTNYKRQIQGKINHELGKVFENQIENICEIYKLNGIAIIEKTPEPLKVLKHMENGHFDAIFTTSAQPDFKGTIKGGRTIVFDAKFTESDKIRYQVLSDYQRETLEKYSEFGALAFILVGFADGKMYKIGIDEWNKMKENYGRKYITEIELEKDGYRVKDTKGMIDLVK